MFARRMRAELVRLYRDPPTYLVAATTLFVGAACLRALAELVEKGSQCEKDRVPGCGWPRRYFAVEICLHEFLEIRVVQGAHLEGSNSPGRVFRGLGW